MWELRNTWIIVVNAESLNSYSSRERRMPKNVHVRWLMHVQPVYHHFSENFNVPEVPVRWDLTPGIAVKKPKSFNSRWGSISSLFAWSIWSREGSLVYAPWPGLRAVACSQGGRSGWSIYRKLILQSNFLVESRFCHWHLIDTITDRDA